LGHLGKILAMNPMLRRVIEIERQRKEDEDERRQAKDCHKESVAYFGEASKVCMKFHIFSCFLTNKLVVYVANHKQRLCRIEVLALRGDSMSVDNRSKTFATKDVVTNVYQQLEALQRQHSIDPLKKLFWTELNYERSNQSLSRHQWPDQTASKLLEDPLLFATGGNNNEFHIIYVRLALHQLPLDEERQIVNLLLKNHLDSLFIFSNQSQDRWHFLNIKADDKNRSRQLFRRITVGRNEKLRTAAERLAILNIATIDPTLKNVPLLDIRKLHEQAFDVEAVTKKFFEQYHRVFNSVQQLIQGFTDLEQKRLFTQRLFNRLMFIAFIQKKGWLKFQGDTNYLTALWNAYRKSRSDESNFYLERLELLFFVGLNTANNVNVIGISQNGFLNTIIGDVPYLNGGLFEKDVQDSNPSLLVPDECIDAILHDLFDRFNFTVTESTPLDIEVAVDPEMLGKVFEELVTGRHETGSYYTPKPVVSFMCREALKGYLQTKLPDESLVAIEQFVDEHNPQELRNPERALDALRRVKVCDPACGSGAYLLGMLHELLDLRACLFNTKRLDSVSVYQRKLEIIQNNVYGVDIDPFATNIARLRLWLSLVVDFEGLKPLPLPNLDFKIEAGDSLIAPDPQGTINLAFRDDVVRQFREKKDAYIKTHEYGEKQTLKQEIDNLRQEITKWTHSGKASVQGFDWAVEFADVFREGGFDIVVANPPYVRQELIKDLKPILQKTFPLIYTGTSDLYTYFYARALQLLRSGGMLTFISSNKWFRANYGAKLKQHIADTCTIFSITDFGDLPVFESATAYPMIFIAQKGGASKGSTRFTQVKTLDTPYPDVLAIIRETGQLLPSSAIDGANWMLTDTTSASRLSQMKKAGVPLGEYVKGQIYYGIKTGFNPAFVIDGAKRAELIAQDPKSAEIIKPLALGKDIKKWHIEDKDRWLIFTQRGINIDSYPAIKAHLKLFHEKLEPRPIDWDDSDEWEGRKPGPYKWYEIQDSIAYYKAFEKPKIVWGNLGLEPGFTYYPQPLYIMAPANIISLDDIYLLGVLNSSISRQFFDDISIQRGGNYLEFKPIYVKQLPIPDPSTSERVAIISLVQKCLDAQGVGCEAWEREIDERVAALYGL
jgi:type I restriction-modification system DNA methylase subunit